MADDIKLPEPVAYLIERHAFRASPHGQDAEGHDWLEVVDRPEDGSFGVYTADQVRAAVEADREQQAAEIERLKADAERYQWLTRKFCFTGNGDGTCSMHAINLPCRVPGWPEPGGLAEFCAAAIDAAMGGE